MAWRADIARDKNTILIQRRTVYTTIASYTGIRGNHLMTRQQASMPEKKTIQDHLKALGGAALIVGLTLLLLELALFLLDPWDMRYFNDLAKMGNEIFTVDAERGYIMPDAHYEFSHWEATIAAGQRVLPDTNPDAACTLAILGDSVGFGYGVNDAEAWVNRLAKQFQNVHFVNLSMPRYNSTNSLLSYQTCPDADAYLYVIINNDLEDALDMTTMEFTGSGEAYPFLVRYANYAMFRGGGTAYVRPDDPDSRVADTPQSRRFFAELDSLLEDERVYLAAFELEPLTNTLVERGYDVAVLAYPPDRISVTDYHLNPQGNATLAAHFLPVIERIIEERCG